MANTIIKPHNQTSNPPWTLLQTSTVYSHHLTRQSAILTTYIDPHSLLHSSSYPAYYAIVNFPLLIDGFIHH